MWAFAWLSQRLRSRARRKRRAVEGVRPSLEIVVLESRRVLDAAPVIDPQTFDVAAGAPNGTTVASVAASDPDPGDMLTYSIIAGNDDGTFSIDGSTGELKVADNTLLGSTPSFNLTVEVADGTGKTASAVITINVQEDTAGNDAPIINDQVFHIPVNSPDSTVVGTVNASDPDGPLPTFSITGGNTGDAFAIDALTGELTVNDATQLTTPQQFVLTVTVTDLDGQFDTASITINVNGPPTDLVLSNDTVAENNDGAVIGEITVSDPDGANDQYSFVVSDNRFEVVGGQLKLKAGETLDHETEPTVNINIQVTDSAGGQYDENFVITVTDSNESPVSVSIDNMDVVENNAGGTVGQLSVIDPDDNSEPFGMHTFQVLEHDGNDYVASTRFEVTPAGVVKLQDGVSLDHEAQASYDVRVAATDGGGLSVNYDFTITVTDANEAPTDITVSNLTVAENSPGAVVGTVQVIDEDDPSEPFGEHTIVVQEDLGGGYVTSTRFEVVGGQLKLKAGVSLDHEAEPTVSVRIVATDGGGLETQQDFDITVTDVNEAPTAIGLNNTSVAEDSPGAIVGTITVTDPDDPSEPFGEHTIVVQEDMGGGYVTSTRFEVVGGQLKLKAGVSLDHETDPTINIRIVATDGGGLPTQDDFVITVTDGNDAPTAIGLNNTSVAENSAGAIIGSVTVTDPDDPLGPFGQHTIEVQEDLGSGYVTSNRFEVVGGQLKLKAGESLDHEADGTVSIRIVATDGGGLATQQDFDITVTDVNEAPTAIGLNNTSVAEDSPGAIVGTITVTDPDDPSEPFGEHTIVVQEDMGGGYVTSTRFEVVGGQLKLKAGVSLDHEAEPTVSVRIVATDGGGLQTQQDFDITVTDANEAPTDIALNNVTVPENSPGAVIGSVTVTDPDDPLGPFGQHTIEVQEDLGSGYVTSNRFEVVGGQLKLKAGESLDHEVDATVNIRIVATDGGGLPTQKDFVITVTDVNEAPTAINLDNQSVDENTPGAVIGNVTVTDVDDPGQPFGQHTYVVEVFDGNSYVATTDFEVVGGVLKLAAGVSLDHEAAQTIKIRITATDGGGLSTQQEYDIAVNDLNDPPVASDDEYTTPSNQVLTGNLITDDTGNGPDTDQDQDPLQVIDAQGNNPGVEFTTLLGAKVTVNADGSFTYDPTESLVLAALTQFVSVNDSFMYTIEDADGATSTATVTITITGVNDPPTVDPTTTESTNEDTTLEYTHAQLLAAIGYFDPDNASVDAVIEIVPGSVSGGTVTLVGGTGGDGTTFRFTPDSNSHADVTFQYRVVDGGGEVSNTGTFTITVVPVNDTPTFNLPPSAINEDGSFTISLALYYSDVETAAADATFQITAQSPNITATIDPVTLELTVTPDPDYNGIFQVTIEVTDTGDGTDGLPQQAAKSVVSILTLTVNSVSDPPIARDEAYTLQEDGSLQVAAGDPDNLLANDTDPDSDPAVNQLGPPNFVDTNSVVVVTPPQHAASFIMHPDGSFEYVPVANYWGTDSFQYIILDSEGLASAPATVTLNITPVNDPPEFILPPVLDVNPVTPAPVPILGDTPGPLEEGVQTITWHVTSADPSVLPPPVVVGSPGNYYLQFSIAPFQDATTSITVTATDNLGLQTVQVIQVNLQLGQVPPSNLQFESRPTISSPVIRDTAPIADLGPVIAQQPQFPLDSTASTGDASTAGQRVVEIYLVDPATGELVGGSKIDLPIAFLDRLNDIFRNLPDDRYRIVLKMEDDSRRPVIDVIVRDGQPFDPGDTREDFIEQMPREAAEQGAAAPQNTREGEAPLPDTFPDDTERVVPASGSDDRAPPAQGATWWALAPLLLGASLERERRRRRTGATRQALHELGLRPHLRHRLRRSAR